MGVRLLDESKEKYQVARSTVLALRSKNMDDETYVVDAETSAVIVVDMWDKHYCKTYCEWGDDLAERLSKALWRYRMAGIPVIFMNADVYSTHKSELGAILLSTLSRKYRAPAVKVPSIQPGLPQWYPGCACLDGACEKVEVTAGAWSRIHPGVDRWLFDLIGDWNLHLGFLARSGIKTLLYAGGAANICVLNARSFSLWQSKAYGYDTVLIGDLTIPFLPARGYDESLELVLDYYRKYICPVYTNKQIVIQGEGNWPGAIIGDVIW